MGSLGHDSEAVSKSARNPQHAFVLAGKFDGFPFTEGRRAAAEVERNIKNLAGDSAHEFSLGLANLVVQAADDILLGVGMVVLYEWLRDAEVGKRALVVAFQKEAAVVAEYTRFKEEKSGKAGGDFFHRTVFIALFDSAKLQIPPL